MENSLSGRYASAMFHLAQEENKIAEYQQEAKVVLKLLDENPKYLLVLDSTLITKEEKYSMLDEAFSHSLSPYMISFLKVILENRRIRHTKEIFVEFVSLCHSAQGILEGIVYTVHPLQEEQISALERVVTQRVKKQVVLKNRLDHHLLGGVKIVIGDVVLDDSIFHRMEELKKSLLKE